MFTELKQSLTPSTLLCIASDITLNSEMIKTMSVSDWKDQTIDIHKRPTIFIIHKY